MRYLCSWWSRTYQRPLKDPLLATYTLEELAYEFYERQERDNYNEEVQEEETDKIEEAKYDDAMKWADEEEAREKAAESQSTQVPVITQEDEEWMEKHLEKEPAFDGVGADIVEEF